VQKLREANERTLVIALIETAAGIASAEAIMAVDGIDIGWLGHFDLTNSMGIPGQFDPDFLAAVDRLVAACRIHGKPAGVLAGSVEAAETWRARGFRIFAYRTDISLLQESLRSGLARLRAGEGHWRNKVPVFEVPEGVFPTAECRPELLRKSRYLRAAYNRYDYPVFYHHIVHGNE
jgi:HpcH/HpaI aldolase/citrate lyase family